mgnify:CR=1 FL=1
MMSSDQPTKRRGRPYGSKNRAKPSFPAVNGTVPTLEANHKSVQTFLTWVTGAIVGGHLDGQQARECREAACAMIRSIRAEHDHKELEQAKEILDETVRERARIEGLVNEARRLGVSIDTMS